jgi:16S rRNA (uracil1498-N3)-methyltransferase
MKRFLVPELPVSGEVVFPKEESQHAVQVLRVQDGETIEVLSGAGTGWLAKARIEGKNCRAEKISEVAAREERAQVAPLELILGIPKADSMEWILEKATELGIWKVTPLQCAHSVVKLERKGADAFLERWKKISDQALKQSGRLTRMVIAAPVTLEEWSRTPPTVPIFWAHERSHLKSPRLESVRTLPAALLIGPEGGFSDREIALLERTTGILPVSLGSWILRTETASIYGLSQLLTPRIPA